MIRIYRHVFWLGVGLIVLGLYVQAISAIMHVPINAPVLAIGEAFRTAPRDSLFTDATDAIGSVIAVGERYENLAGSIERDEFVCLRSELRRENPHFMCRKEAWSLWRIMPRKEAWTIEIICEGAAHACTVKDLHASIGPA